MLLLLLWKKHIPYKSDEYFKNTREYKIIARKLPAPLEKYNAWHGCQQWFSVSLWIKHENIKGHPWSQLSWPSFRCFDLPLSFISEIFIGKIFLLNQSTVRYYTLWQVLEFPHSTCFSGRYCLPLITLPNFAKEITYEKYHESVLIIHLR